MYYINRTDIKIHCALPIELKHGNPIISQEIPAWSLAALLDVLPEYIDYNTIYQPHIMRVKGNNYMVLYSSLKHSEIYDNPVDACVEMIIHLKERNLL